MLQLIRSELKLIRSRINFGAIKDENMNGKIRVSIVATSLKGSISPDQDQF